MKQEFWKPIPGYKGYYSASSLGRIRRDKQGWGHCKANKILKHAINKKGYSCLGLTKNWNRKTFFVSSLIAKTFIGPRPKGYQINHKDTIKSNNSAPNLEYVTNLENMRHAIKHGLFKNAHKHGEHNGNSRLRKKEVLKIRKEYSSGKIFQRPLAKKYKVCQRTIWMIVHRETWKHI